MSPRIQIVIFILFAAGLFLFIRLFSANPLKKSEQAEAVVGQIILPTPQADEVSAQTFTSQDGSLTLDYPNDWEAATPSGAFLPDTPATLALEVKTIASPDGLKGVTIQIIQNNRNLTLDSLFNCTGVAACKTGTFKNTGYISPPNSGGIRRVGVVKNNRLYILKISESDAEDIISSISFQ
jgi:hypothetical protein